MKIYIDAGHGGNSTGASYKGRIEQNDTLKLSLAVGELLKKQGVEVKYSRTTSVNPTLSARAAEANNWGADYFISIHRNAFEPNKAKGAEVHIYSKAEKGGDTYKKAETILNDLCKATGFASRGVWFGYRGNKNEDYAVNRETNMHSCLLEVGFIDNDGDNAIFDSKFNAMAEAIAKGLCAAVGVEYKAAQPEAKAPEKTENTGVLYKVQIGAFKEKKNAEEYAAKATKAGFTAIVIKEVKGDIDGDGKVTAADARLGLRKAVGLDE